MFKDGTLGDKARYVCPHADCQNRQKRFLAQSYAAIFAFLIALSGWLYNPLPSYAGTQYICYALVNNGNRITSVYTGGYTAGSSTINNRPVTLPLVRDFCHDSGTGYYYSGYYGWGQNASLLATRVVSLPDTSDHTDNVQSWDMSTVASKLGCSAASGKALSFPGINQIIALLPQSPTNMRIPTLITKMTGENSLAGNLAVELYSGAWQFLGILTSFKLFKTFFKGG